MLTSGVFRLVSLALVVVFSATSSGCYSSTAIRPDQIPLLSEMPSPTVVGQSGNATIVAVPVATVLTPEGTTVEIKGAYDLVLGNAIGQEFRFEHSVRSTLISPGVLEITGANRPATRFNLSDILSAEIVQSSSTGALIALTLIGVVSIGAIMVIGLSGSSGG